MAVGFTNSLTQTFTNNAGLPTTRLFTITAWVYFISLPGPAAASACWSLDGSSSDAAYLGVFNNTSTVTIVFDWVAGGSSERVGGVVTTNTWYKTAVVVNGTAATLYYSDALGTLTSYTSGANFTLPATPLSVRLGGSLLSSLTFNGRLASFKLWDAALTQAEIEQELRSYQPERTTNLNRWYPLINTEYADYSGNGRTLSGGTGATAEIGPPIPWRGHRDLVIPWDSTTPIWYAIYDDTTGNLISGDNVISLPLASGLAYKTYLGGQPDPYVFGWDTTARDYVFLDGIVRVDRVADLLADGTLSAVWADLSGANSTTLQNRIGQLLGPFRYRRDYQDVDLTLGFGPPN